MWTWDCGGEFPDLVDTTSQHGATHMNSEGVTPAELSPALETYINSSAQFPDFCMSGMSGPTKSILRQEVEQWTPNMDAFVIARKLQGDTVSLIAEKMQEKFGVPVNPNVLHDEWERNIKIKLRDCIVIRAFTNATPHIIQIVQDEIKRLIASNYDPPSEVKKGHSGKPIRDLKL